VNGHYGFRRELPTSPLAVRSPPTVIRSYPRLALPSAGDGTIVHLRLLPGLVDDYRQLVERALAS
jgi:hypothetical protein